MPGWHEMGHNRCPQYINDYNFVENFDSRKQNHFAVYLRQFYQLRKIKDEIIIKPPTIYDKAYLKYKMSMSAVSNLEYLSGKPIILGYENDRHGNLNSHRTLLMLCGLETLQLGESQRIERNLDCWYNKKPITCFSVYGNIHTFNTHMTLLSPRHALMAHHIFDDFAQDTIYGGAYKANPANGYMHTLTAAHKCL